MSVGDRLLPYCLVRSGTTVAREAGSATCSAAATSLAASWHGGDQSGVPDCWLSSPGQTPVSLRVPSAAPRSAAALTSANIAPCRMAASRTSPSRARHRWLSAYHRAAGSTSRPAGRSGRRSCCRACRPASRSACTTTWPSSSPATRSPGQPRPACGSAASRRCGLPGAQACRSARFGPLPEAEWPLLVVLPGCPAGGQQVIAGLA